MLVYVQDCVGITYLCTEFIIFVTTRVSQKLDGLYLTREKERLGYATLTQGSLSIYAVVPYLLTIYGWDCHL